MHRDDGQHVRVISERHQAMLEFERTFWTLDDPKPGAIRRGSSVRSTSTIRSSASCSSSPKRWPMTRSSCAVSSGSASGGDVSGSTRGPTCREAHTDE